MGRLGAMQTDWKDDVLSFRYATVEDIDDYATMLAKHTVCEHVFFGPNSRDETIAMVAAGTIFCSTR